MWSKVWEIGGSFSVSLRISRNESEKKRNFKDGLCVAFFAAIIVKGSGARMGPHSCVLSHECFICHRCASHHTLRGNLTYIINTSLLTARVVWVVSFLMV